jgi:hypothetical protein
VRDFGRQVSKHNAVKVAPLYSTVIERSHKKTRYSSISVQDSMLVAEAGKPSPISICRQPSPRQAFVEEGDLGISIQLRLDGYAVAPLRWFRDRGIDPVAMRDESREYRETFFSVIRRAVRRWPELWWRIKHPTGRRAVDVERV